MNYYYSPLNGGFYIDTLKDDYVASDDGWPDDAIQISNSLYSQLIEGQSGGKIIAVGEDGAPLLVDRPLPTAAELILAADSQREMLMAEANAAVTPLQDAVDIGDATDAETALLNAWKKYRVALNRLDLSAAPDIDWPEIPA